MEKYYIKSKSQFKEHKKSITNSSNIFNNISFGKGIDSKSMIVLKVKNDFSTALKNGLARGERAVTNYKRNFPLMTRGRDLKFAYDNEKNIIINWVNKIQFKCLLSENYHKNALELKHTLHKLIDKEYTLSQSSLYFNSKNELILILTMDIPESNEKYETVKDRTLGVDLGIAVPVYMSLNDNKYIKKSLGSYAEFAKQKTQYYSRCKRQNDIDIHIY